MSGPRRELLPEFWQGSYPELIELGHVLRVLSNSSLEREARFEADEVLVLRLLGWRGPRSMAEIAATLRITPARVRAVCGRLERLGLAGKEPHDSDRRVRVVVLTDRGRTVAERVLSRSANLTRDLLEGLDAGQREECLRVVRLLVERGHALLEAERRHG